MRRSYLNTAPGVKPPPISMDEHHRVALGLLDAIDRNYDFSRKVGPELRKMCKIRADKYTRDRVSAGFATILGALVLTFLFVGFYISVRRSVDALGLATTKMIAGTNETFKLAAKDELGGIGNAY